MPIIHIHYPHDTPVATLVAALALLQVTPRLNSDGDLIARTPGEWRARDQRDKPRWPQDRPTASCIPDRLARLRAALRGDAA